MNRARTTGPVATRCTATRATIIRNRVPIGSWSHPSCVGAYADDNFITTHKKKKMIGLATSAATNNRTARTKRRRPDSEATNPHITPRPTAPKYAATNCAASVNSSITAAVKHSK